MADGFTNAPPLPGGYQAHHVIPQGLWSKSQTLLTLIGAGRVTTGTSNGTNAFSLQDFDKNGIGLPEAYDGSGLSEHSGSHPHYSSFINLLLDDAAKDIKNRNNPTSAELDLLTSRVDRISAVAAAEVSARGDQGEVRSVAQSQGTLTFLG